MCGIVGFIGQEQAAPILLDGLAHLEYRGYDSAGVAVISAQGKLQVEKAVGRLKVLSEQIHGGADLEGCIGLGHTRWATHGAPNIINSHPHVSENGKFAVIHNGIIENYVEIKEFLIGQGIRFKSETDTEVVAQLLEFYYNECHDFLEAVGRVLRRIEGAYALGMLCADCPDRIIAARKDAPLLLGYGKGCNFLASDVTAIIKHTRDVAYMEDGEVAVLTREGIEVYDALEQKVEKKHFTIDWEVSAAEKGGYQHFMLKEIMEQPEALRRAISPRIKDGRVIFDDLKLPVEKMREFTRIFIVACGSSYHVGMIGKYNLEHLLRRNVEVVLASEFRYSDPIVDDKSLVIVISQSGETLDTMAALREAKKRGGYILSIVNVVGSSIARESDDVLYTWAGPEIAVATTKAYSTQLAVLDMIGLAFGEALGTVKKEEYDEAVAELQKLPEKMEQFLASESCEAIPKYASQYFNHNSVFFIGRNLDYALGLEGSLKLKEISYIHSEAYASGELKHGTISLIEDGTLVIALGTYAPLFDKAMSNVVEVKARGADVLALATESHRGEMAKTVENVITIPDTAQMLLPSLGVVPLQLLAYYIALQRGCDIDKPRNLAKSVTVE
ncbi:MAG TPA: glutamine--fructose-6-phosphate transaminase (isomerizing) [Oscillibacter sp.]|jgi:glucosamine--fructose-6-phosphate aminotransferase (isomerizing)|nr:glutamine--fructose-6-phosphate transaminase (isomerizing) [Oscillospiraceae bacterium]MED9886281.1 glutamine--fructose-6-phosphate transaminase (isomerizing) [Oscillospiraceae bacterium]MEE0179180.1 glutamine--fructose-6-phosphate transaminase (isomerizing) [Oscillospiraceae bacterium]HAT79419.1 glutamine--fructose-6-phosphate transaminase (isomerizing) [Oscillibacter sp.]HCQ51452.1 glutamine--fructose-6-phosphate transaminase (isomerizing) [Oscillibacter sp.]